MYSGLAEPEQEMTKESWEPAKIVAGRDFRGLLPKYENTFFAPNFEL